ncbi:MAG: NAD-dependent epimerase/dehydratase family protein [Chloroflexi bacterium]|nr:MAG: NAD-dependent epimerase/dehydratase family protein [Chloroflexota bacterium]
MIALVTGSTGFVGGAICRKLVREGYKVRAFHRESSRTLLLDNLPPHSMEHCIGDITRPETLKPALRDVEIVFHAAAQLGKPYIPEKIYTATVQGTRNLLQAAGEAGVKRVVHTSSVAALGVPEDWNGNGSPPLLDENHTWNYKPQDYPYGYSKYLAEMEVQRAVAQGLDVVIVNPGVVLGAGDINRVGGSILLHMSRGHIPVSIQAGLNAVHIDDVVCGHLAALEKGKTGERYILGGENLTVTEFLEIIGKSVGRRTPKFILPAWAGRMLSRPIGMFGDLVGIPINRELLLMAGKYFFYDMRKARNELGLNEPRPVFDAAREAIDWYRAQEAC